MDWTWSLILLLVRRPKEYGLTFLLGENDCVLLGFLTCLKVLLNYLKKVLPVKK